MTNNDETTGTRGSTGTGWTYPDVWEICATVRGSSPALVHGDHTVSWTDFNRRANGLAATMLAAGVTKQDKVAQYLYNCTEYLEGVYGTFKASLVPVNTNYRYSESELLYLWDNSDAAVVMFHGTFVPTVEAIRQQCDKVKLWLHVDDGSHACPDWAMPFEEAAQSGTDDNVSGPWGRSGDDLWLLYTGGTTGMPKGVMWAQSDLVDVSTRTTAVAIHDDTTAEQWVEFLETTPPSATLPGAPLMHGTGQLTSLGELTAGGTIVTLTNRSYDPIELLDAVQANKVNRLAIVGDVFARPIVESLDAEPDRWDVSSVVLTLSSGVMWSHEIKVRMLDHMPTMVVYDALSSSEALGMGTSFSTKENISSTAKFELGENAAVIRDDGELVEAGSGDIGRLGVEGVLPVGYYKDKAKSDATFPTINGIRYSIPGDYATVEADGSITLLGRGSVCINTGGEKVFPEEVEEALKTHDSVTDAIAVGVPDERFGQRIVAVVESTDATAIEGSELISHVKDHLAAYKAPKSVLFVDSLTRAPNGKIDYKRWSSYAASNAS